MEGWEGRVHVWDSDARLPGRMCKAQKVKTGRCRWIKQSDPLDRVVGSLRWGACMCPGGMRVLMAF